MYGDVGIAERQKVRKPAGKDDGIKQYTTPYILFSLYMYYAERYVRWGCILNCFMPSSLLVFAVLLSLHLHTFLMFFTLVAIYSANNFASIMSFGM